MRRPRESPVSGPCWYHSGMAMTLRLPPDVDRQLEALATSEHTSKQALVVEAVESIIRQKARRAKIDRAYEYTFERYGDVMERLADA